MQAAEVCMAEMSATYVFEMREEDLVGNIARVEGR